MKSNVQRCGWCKDDPQYVAYHDEEWGVPMRDPQDLFELLILEGMQAGLAWITVLRKREHMQKVFFNFDMQRLASASQADMARWLADPGVIRHRGKLQAMCNNAQCALEIDQFGEFLWQFAPKRSPRRTTPRSVPAQTPDSVAMSKALRKAGFKFVGPTICYAFMQSAGMVNDHLTRCWRYEPCAKLQAA